MEIGLKKTPKTYISSKFSGIYSVFLNILDSRI
jgi:hypothetical protein